MPLVAQQPYQSSGDGPDEPQLLIGPDGTVLVDILALPDAYASLSHDSDEMSRETFVTNAKAVFDALLSAKDSVCTAWLVELNQLGQDHAAFGDLNSAIGSLDSYEKGWRKVLRKLGDGQDMDDESIKDNGVGRQTRDEVIAYFARARDDLQKEAPKFRALHVRAVTGWTMPDIEPAEDSHSHSAHEPKPAKPKPKAKAKAKAKGARPPSAFAQFKKEQRAKLRLAASNDVAEPETKAGVKRNAKSVGDSAGSSPDSKHAKPSSDTGKSHGKYSIVWCC
jgi:hypothetical protein